METGLDGGDEGGVVHEDLSVSKGSNYLTACTEPSKLPQHHFCAACGSSFNYTCATCVRCLATHHETSGPYDPVCRMAENPLHLQSP